MCVLVCTLIVSSVSHPPGAVTPEEVRLLFATASLALDGSLIEMACLRLLSSLLKADPKVFHLLLKDAKLAGARPFCVE